MVASATTAAATATAAISGTVVCVAVPVVVPVVAAAAWCLKSFLVEGQKPNEGIDQDTPVIANVDEEEDEEGPPDINPDEGPQRAITIMQRSYTLTVELYIQWKSPGWRWVWGAGLVRGCSHVPEYLGHCMVEDTLFLAMSLVEGIPMGQWAQIVQRQSFTTCVRDISSLAPLRICIRSHIIETLAHTISTLARGLVLARSSL